MMRRVYDTSLKLSFMALLLIIPQLAHGLVLWHDLADLVCPGGNPGITMDVTDEDIDIQGVNAIYGPIRVTAATQDILITVTNVDSVITGSARCDGQAVPEPRLYLQADTDRTITVQLDFDLLFRGTAQPALPQDLLQDLLVAVVGDGEVVFQLADGSAVTFGSLPTSGGTQMYVGMSDDVNPLLRFERTDINADDNVEVVVGDRSCITFISDEADGDGSLEFAPTNQSPIGMLILRILPCGSFVIAGHELDADLSSDFVLGDVNLAVPFGNEAFMGIVNRTDVANGINAFRVINENFCCTNLNIDPFCDGAFTGTQNGFILGPVGVLDLDDLTYIDYIGTTSNICCEFTKLDDCNLTVTDARLRNGSAFIVDAIDDETPVEIRLNGRSGIYFRSGIDKCGQVDEEVDFVINFADRGFEKFKTPCAGNIVFDIEGPLVIEGDLDNDGNPLGGIQVLSLEVTKTGCPILVNGGGPALFPERTFERNDLDEYLRYNSAGVLVNNALNFLNTALVHTDQNHNVYEEGNLGNPTLSSEPTYIGGDTFELCKFQDGRTNCRPFMSFFNSEFRVHTSVALTGVDLRVPNDDTPAPDSDNNSRFLFYNNGRCIDDGSGRNMILGTNPCFDVSGCCYASLDKDSHLDVMQTTQGGDAVNDNTLCLETRFNTTCIIEGIVEDAAGCAIQTIYLNNGSNISIGNLPVNTTAPFQGVDCFGNNFNLVDNSTLSIKGACFSFETAGGILRYPQSSGTTGQGGIFVDYNGTFEVGRVDGRPYIANIGAMVTKSHNGAIDLPKESVFFDSRVGIQQWRLDLNDPSNRVIVAAGQSLSDYTLDWENVRKELCCTNDTSLTCFRPYEIKELPQPCDCPPVTNQNLTALPVVEGIVDQFQVVRSRICDPMHLKVSGGAIRELTFLVGFNSAEAPVAFVVIEDDGTVGLGSAALNKDSNCANIVLGVNGVQIVANGDSNVVLNEDILINNVCHFLSGTSFGLDEPQTLKIYSPVPRELRIKSSGTLDLSQFDNENKILEIGGQVLLLAEPGARIILNGGTLLFSDEARFELDQVLNLNALFAATSVSDTDAVRVVMSGNGRVEFTENSSMFVQQGSYFGIETMETCSNITTITFSLLDQSSVQIGTEESPGGSFQIGNTTNKDDNEVNFFLIMGGEGVFGNSGGRGTVFQVDRQGFLGLDVGIVDKLSQIPNLWSVGNLWNVGTIGIDIQEGRFRHDQIITGDSARASLIAIGDEGTYNFTFAPLTTEINAGGNLVLITGATDVNPTVTTFAGTHSSDQVTTNIMSGKFLLVDSNKPSQPVGVLPSTLFLYLSTLDFTDMATKRANYSSEQLNIGTLGFIRMDSIIERLDIPQGAIGTLGGQPTEADHSLEIGAVGFNLAPVTGGVSGIVEIIGLTVS